MKNLMITKNIILFLLIMGVLAAGIAHGQQKFNAGALDKQYLEEAAKADKRFAQKSFNTSIGQLDFTNDFINGYPTKETTDKLFDEIDFQRACQAYLWSIPYVSMSQWYWAHREQLGAVNGQAVFVTSYMDKIGGLTYNTTTPYVLPFINLKDGPWVVDVPPAEIRGAFSDAWQVGANKVYANQKFLLVGPEHKVPKDANNEGYTAIKMNTNLVLPGIRLMARDDKARMDFLENLKIYPYSEKDNPKPRGYVKPEGKLWQAWQPRGMDYWKRLSEIINNEPVHERDRFFLAMLKPLGIEKGKPFNPTDHQKKILAEAALVGEAMAKANDFDKKRMESAFYVEGSAWEFATVATPDQRYEYHDALDERAAWFYEAVTNDPRMHGQEFDNNGQIYFTAYKDGDGDWLDGRNNYTLHVPANPPAKKFWSITLYDVATRCIIVNNIQRADLSSLMDLHKNSDGSLDLYFGPEKPDGVNANNWIETLPGKAWFPYFRFYSPMKPLTDKTWILPNIEKVK